MKKWGGPILSHLCQFLDFKFFYKCLTFHRGKKTLFFRKCPNNGLVSEKKIHCIFRYNRGGGEVRPKCNICFIPEAPILFVFCLLYIICLFFKEGVFYYKRKKSVTWQNCQINIVRKSEILAKQQQTHWTVTWGWGGCDYLHQFQTVSYKIHTGMRIIVQMEASWEAVLFGSEDELCSRLNKNDLIRIKQTTLTCHILVSETIHFRMIW